MMLKLLAVWLVCALAVAMLTTGPASVVAFPAQGEKDGGASTDDTVAAQLAAINDDDALVSDTTSSSMDDDYNAMAASSKEDADDVSTSTGRREPNLNTVHVSSLEPSKLFQLIKIACPLQAARNWCRHHGMRLAVPRSAFENLLVRLTCEKGHNCWIGVNDIHHEGRYVDDDYRPLKFTNWYHAEPNNVHNEDCTEIYGFNGLWNDQHCNQHRFFVCSRV